MIVRKKSLLFSLFVAAFFGFADAEQAVRVYSFHESLNDQTVSRQRNSLAAGLSYTLQDEIGMGLNLEYGYSFNDKYSVSLTIGTDSLVIPYINIGGRWFPWSKTFFAGIGVGIWGLHPEYPAAFSISPNIGWKINIGENKNWFITPSLAARVIVFTKDDLLSLIYHFPYKAGVQFGYNF